MKCCAKSARHRTWNRAIAMRMPDAPWRTDGGWKDRMKSVRSPLVQRGSGPCDPRALFGRRGLCFPFATGAETVTPRRAENFRRLAGRQRAAKKPLISPATFGAFSSRTKCPLSSQTSLASGRSRLNASAPAGMKKGSLLPQTISVLG